MPPHAPGSASSSAASTIRDRSVWWGCCCCCASDDEDGCHPPPVPAPALAPLADGLLRARTVAMLRTSADGSKGAARCASRSSAAASASSPSSSSSCAAGRSPRGAPVASAAGEREDGAHADSRCGVDDCRPPAAPRARARAAPTCLTCRQRHVARVAPVEDEVAGPCKRLRPVHQGENGSHGGRVRVLCAAANRRRRFRWRPCASAAPQAVPERLLGSHMASTRCVSVTFTHQRRPQERLCRRRLGGGVRGAVAHNEKALLRRVQDHQQQPPPKEVGRLVAQQLRGRSGSAGTPRSVKWAA